MIREVSGIAIIGMGLRFPGAETPVEYWNNLRDGVESLTHLSVEELIASGISADLVADPNYVRSRFMLGTAGEFDAGFFDVSSHEASITDPQFRVFLQCAWEAIEHAGYDLERYRGAVGVYAGSSWSSYLPNVVAAHGATREVYLRNEKDFLATWTSYKLNLRGPSLGVQSYCSTSLAAVHVACQSLWNFECDMALAGGVSITVPLRSGYYRTPGDSLSADGHCRPYSAMATGIVFGDGAGVVLLKRMEDAIADGDFIHAVIRGSAINNDGGARPGYSAPSIQGQEAVLTQALANAAVEPRSICYVEGHGTGTLLGDAMEVTALRRVFSRSSKDRQFCALGSAKANVGHLDRASGASSLIKTVLALQHRLLPPTLFGDQSNPDIDFATSPFFVSRELLPMPDRGELLRAGVTSLGIGGTNVHVVLEEAPRQFRPQRPDQDYVLPLSAPSERALSKMRKRLASYLRDHGGLDLADVAYTLQAGRQRFSQRSVTIARDAKEAIALLESEPVAERVTEERELTDTVSKFRVPLPTFPFERMLHWIDSPLTVVHAVSRLPKIEVVEFPEPAYEDACESRLAEIWAQVLGRERPGRTQRFLDLGGHSLAAAQVASRVRHEFGVNIEMVDLFESPTLALLASRVRRAQTEAPVQARESTPICLSFGQERIWFLHQMEPDTAAFNISIGLEIEGSVELPALERAFQEVIARHEPLRTVYRNEAGRPVAEVLPAASFKIERTSTTPENLEQMLHENSCVAFDIARGPMLRVRMFELNPQHCFVLLVVHHIAADGWSVPLLEREVLELYGSFVRGEHSPLSPLLHCYSDFAFQQRDEMSGSRKAKLLEYWKTQLQGISTPFAGQSIASPAEASVIPFHLSSQTANRLQELGAAAGATLFMVLLAALQLVIHRFTGESDVTIGAPVAGRHRREWEGLVGFFLNTLVLRTDLSGDPSFRDLLQRSRATCLEALRHQSMPFELLVAELRPERHSIESPFFQVLLILQSYPMESITVPGLQLLPREIHTGAVHAPLTLQLTPSTRGLDGFVEFDPRFLSALKAQGLRDFFGEVLRVAASDPDRKLSEFSWLVPAEKGGRETPSGKLFPVHRRIFRNAQTKPHAVAVQLGSRKLTYGELTQQAVRFSNMLYEAGVVPGDVVGLHASRSPEWIGGMLGILEAGAAYLPLDPSQPLDRRRLMCSDARVQVILCEDGADSLGLETIPLLFGQSATDAPSANPIDPEQLAYAIYTSGTSGRPKAVAVQHGSLAQLTESLMEELKTTPQDRYLQFASLSWDTSIEEIFPCLCAGATLILRDEEMLEPAEFCRRVEEFGITFVDLPTAYWNALASYLSSTGTCLPGSLHTVMIGGEAARKTALADWWSAVSPSVRLVNSYGASEITAISLLCDLLPDSLGVPLGRPIRGCLSYILDRALHPLPTGIAGELYIGGTGVSRGYLQQPGWTAALFLPDPFTSVPGQRMYRTGDLVVRRADGLIEFEGRLDRQLKIRGHRVEPAEIENLLRQVEGVNEAVVVAAGSDEHRFLAAIYTATPDALDERAVRKALATTLPEFLVPSRVVCRESLPRTVSGKVDLRAVAESFVGTVNRPITSIGRALHPHEELLGALWADVLGHSAPTSAEDDFFELGGHSLLATQLVARIRRAFGIDLPLRSVFDHSSLANMAEQIWIRTMAGTSPNTAPSRQEFDGAMAVSLAQQRLWFLQRMFPGMAAYNMPVVLHHLGVLDTARLSQCFDIIVRRHQPLNCVFAEVDGLPFLKLIDSPPLEIPEVDLRSREREAAIAEAWRIALDQVQRPFELSKWPLFRVLVIRLAEEEYATLFTIHHILADAWSMRVMSREVASLYEALGAGKPAILPPLPIRFSDFAQWQRKRLNPALQQALIEFWRKTLDGIVALHLPYDYSRSALTEFRGAAFQWTVEPGLAVRIKELGRCQGATLFVTLLSAFSIVLNRYSGQKDFVVGFPVSGRGQPEIEDLIGFFVNILTIRPDLSGEPTFLELIQRTRGRVLAALKHQDLPFEELVEQIRPRRAVGRNPLFQVCFSVNSAMPGAPQLEGQLISPVAIDTGTTKFELSLSFADAPDSLIAFLEYDSTLFAETTIHAMAKRIDTVLGELCEHPEQKIESKAERCPGLSGSQPEWLGHTVTALIADQVAVRGDEPAVTYLDETLSYRQLDFRAREVSRALRNCGAGPESRIGLRTERCLDMVVSLLGILQAGCAWVPIDVHAPEERVRTVMRDADVEIVLPDPRLPVDSSGVEHETGLTAENLCYVIYTSGSTGAAKGVMTEHHAISNRLLWMRNAFSVGPGDRILHKTPLTFDVSVWELLLPLISGATIVLAEPGRHTDMRYIAELMASECVTVAHFVPSALHEFLNERELDGIRNLRCVIASGEVLPPALSERFFERLPGNLFNLYGPTEAAVDVTAMRCNAGEARAVGWPIANVRVEIMDEMLRPVAHGIEGEICIGGLAPARGYLGRPDITAAAFVADPSCNQPGARLYRTGDRGCVGANGVIEYFGRLDSQVKLRGVRIELAEIETALRRHPSVADAAVVLRTQPVGDILDAFVVASSGGLLNSSHVRDYLRGILPEAMIPARVQVISRMPLTAHGKLDRAALLNVKISPQDNRVEPRSEVEIELARVWCRHLNLDVVGVHDNFFELGGHSLLLARVAAGIRSIYGVEVGLAALFEDPTIHGMTAAIAMAQLENMDDIAREALFAEVDIADHSDAASTSSDAGGPV